MNIKPVKTPTYVNAPGIVRLDFLHPDFSALVDNKGYDVIWERAFPCPCAKRQGTPMSTCLNCQGTGWVFINPTQIKAVAQSLNKETKYKEWSQERLGTASFTVRPEYHLNYMDKLTLLGTSTRDSENRLVYSIQVEDKFYKLISTIYPIDVVIDIFKFVAPNLPLERLKPETYKTKNRFVVFEDGVVKDGDSLSIVYDHKVQYHILDLNHDIRNTIILDDSSREKLLELPISAIGRRVHNVIDAQNYSNTNLLNNSYEGIIQGIGDYAIDTDPLPFIVD